MYKKILTIISILILFLLVITVPVYALSPSSSVIYRGIDVSEWQGEIDFARVKEAGIEIVYIRAGQGFSYEDAEFERNYTEARRNGLKIGVYHYMTARSVEDARLQAQFFASLISGKQIDCRLAMDFESFGSLSRSQINEIAVAYMDELKRLTGKEVVVYSNTYDATYVFNSEVAREPLWVAQYGVNEPQDNGNWGNWIGYQYSSSGRVNGINGNVDLDEYTEDILLESTQEIPEVEDPKCNKEDRILYRVKRGDTLSEIALEHNTTVNHLVLINDIQNPNLIFVGEILTISCNHNNSNGTGNTSEENIILYTIKRGDTLSEIALEYDTTVISLVELNNIQNPNLIYAGETLRIQTDSGTSQNYYTVKRGDTLSEIARKYNTTVNDLVEKNDIINPNLIYPGERLRIR